MSATTTTANRPAPTDQPGCAGSPYGDNWAVWQKDFFDPAAPLLAAAPWVLVRGNHELCSRGGHGWFRLLDPHPETDGCTETTSPYALRIGALNLLLFDGADADDATADPTKVTFYRDQLQTLLATCTGACLAADAPADLGAGARPRRAAGRDAERHRTGGDPRSGAGRAGHGAVGPRPRLHQLRFRPVTSGAACRRRGRRHQRRHHAADQPRDRHRRDEDTPRHWRSRTTATWSCIA